MADFIAEFETTGSDETVTIPAGNTGTYNATIDWGDESADSTITTYNDADLAHTYADAGTYDVTISGTFPWLYFNNGGDKLKLKEIKSWGDIGQTSLSGAFYGCSNMTCTATDTAGWSLVTNMSSTFRGCSLFNGAFGDADTSAVTTMYQMFYDCDAFNQSLGSNFDTSAVTTMANMFYKCSAFNQSLGSNFDTSAVTSMRAMFYDCDAFNQSLGSNFDTSAVTNMADMFYACDAFNQSLGSNFDTSAVTNMSGMFYQCTAFNQSLGSNFDTSAVTNMANMFYKCSAFNQSLGSLFDTSAVTSMYAMFSDCDAFNQSLGSLFDTSAVTSMGAMFRNCDAFDQSLSDFDIEAVTGLSNFALGVTLSQTNYDALLISWAAQTVTASLTTHFGSSTFSATGQEARYDLIANDSWTITDGGRPGFSSFNWVGEDYSSISAWEGDTDNNLEIAAEGETLEIYADDGDVTENPVLSGATSDATYYRTLIAATDNRHNGAWTASAVVLDYGAGTSNNIRVLDTYAEVGYLQLTGGVATNKYVFYIAAANVKVYGCIADIGGVAHRGAYLASDGIEFFRNIMYDSTSPQGGISINHAGVKVYDNTIINCRQGIEANAAGLARNNISIDNSDHDYSGTFDGASSNNISSDSTGSSGLQDRDATANASPGAGDWVIFENITAGSEDYRLQDNATDNDAQEAGVDLGSPYDVDIAGNTVTGNWDIGAFQISTGGGGTPKTDTTSLSAYLQAAKAQTVAAEAYLQAEKSITFGTLAYLAKQNIKTLGVEAHLQVQKTALASLASYLQDQKNVTASLNGWLSAVASNSVYADLEGYLQGDKSLFVNALAYLQKQDIETADVQAYLEKQSILTASSTAYLEKQITLLASADAYLKGSFELSTTLNGWLTGGEAPGVSVFTSTWSANTSTGTQDLTASCGGATPDAGIFFLTGTTVDGALTDHVQICTGIADGTTGSCVWGTAKDAKDTSQAVRGVDSTKLLVITTPGTSTIDGEAELVSAIENGFQIDWTDAPTAAYQIIGVFFCGLDDAKVVKIDGGTLNTEQTISGLGFEPTNLFGVYGAVDDTTSRSFLRYALGIAKRDGFQGFVEMEVGNNKAVSSAASRQSTNYFLGALVPDDPTIEVTDWNSDGFKVTPRGAASEDSLVLALDFGDAKTFMGSMDYPKTSDLDVNDQYAYTSLLFEPGFILRLNCLVPTENLEYGDRGGLSATIVDNDEAERSVSLADEDNQDVTNTNQIASTGYDILSSDGSTSIDGSHISFDANGWTDQLDTSVTTTIKSLVFASQKQETVSSSMMQSVLTAYKAYGYGLQAAIDGILASANTDSAAVEGDLAELRLLSAALTATLVQHGETTFSLDGFLEGLKAAQSLVAGFLQKTNTLSASVQAELVATEGKYLFSAISAILMYTKTLGFTVTSEILKGHQFTVISALQKAQSKTVGVKGHLSFPPGTWGYRPKNDTDWTIN